MQDARVRFSRMGEAPAPWREAAQVGPQSSVVAGCQGFLGPPRADTGSLGLPIGGNQVYCFLAKNLTWRERSSLEVSFPRRSLDDDAFAAVRKVGRGQPAENRRLWVGEHFRPVARIGSPFPTPSSRPSFLSLGGRGGWPKGQNLLTTLWCALPGPIPS